MAEISQGQLETPTIYPVNLVRMDLPGFTARFSTLIGPLPALSSTFEGAGRVMQIGEIEGSLESVAPTLNLTFSALPMQDGEGNDLVAELIEYIVKGSPCWVWFCLLDADFALIADPDLVFHGRLDAPVFEVGETATVSVDIIGAMEWAMKREVGRWNPANHESIWPGDEFFEFVGRRPQPFAGTAPAPNVQAVQVPGQAPGYLENPKKKK